MASCLHQPSSEEYRSQVNTYNSFLSILCNVYEGYQTVITYWCTTTTSCILMNLSCRVMFIKMDLALRQSIKNYILISGQALFLQISWEIAWVNALVPQETEKDNVNFGELRYWWENIESMYRATHNGLGSQAATAAWLCVWKRETCRFSISRTSELSPPLLFLFNSYELLLLHRI